eukprot:6287552-Lingulodinium_polyedra.AAC.1
MLGGPRPSSFASVSRALANASVPDRQIPFEVRSSKSRPARAIHRIGRQFGSSEQGAVRTRATRHANPT